MPVDLAGQPEVLRARRALREFDTVRLIRTALSQGVSQADIAKALELSQATVSRLAARAESTGQAVSPTVDEIIDRAVAGEIDRGEMLRELGSLPISHRRHAGGAGSAWAALRRARRHN